MIQLIATDVDGTLVKESASSVSDEVLAVMRELVDSGYALSIATGRQYGSIRKMFAKVNRDFFCIAENGAHILYGSKTLRKTIMKREEVEAIMMDLRKLYPRGCHVVASTANGCYVESKDADFLYLIKQCYQNDVICTEDILSENVEYVKLAVYKKGDIHLLEELIPKWQDKVKCCIAGAQWLDFMDKSVDKGEALVYLQNLLGATKETTMVFGDNDNDIGMLQKAQASYAVSNANERVIGAANYTCRPYWENGALEVMKSCLYPTGERR